MTGRTLLPDVRSGYIISVCTVEGWQELTLEFEDILQRYVFRFGFVWFQHILYMQFFHLDLPCARCGQNSAAPFTESTVPCESLLAFLVKESTSLRETQSAPQSRKGPDRAWINTQSCHAWKILTAMRATCCFDSSKKSPVADFLQYLC